MENSLSSCVNKAVASKGTADCSEESGWTAYFEDFSRDREHSFSNYSFGTSSLVSDAASSAAWKNSSQNDLKIPKRLCFKKTRTKVISVEDSLEDTASSPVNSPKVRLNIFVTLFYIVPIFCIDFLFLFPCLNFVSLANIFF